MAGKNIAVFGIYRSDVHAERAALVLMESGFTNDDISVLLQDSDSTRAFAHELNTKVPEGAATGATAGGVVGGTFGFLAGIGALAIPGVGAFVAAGPIMSALAGMGAGGALGGLIGALIGMGIPEFEAKRFEGRIKEGGVLLSVHCNSSVSVRRAENLLKQTGAQDIASTGEASVNSEKSQMRPAAQG